MFGLSGALARWLGLCLRLRQDEGEKRKLGTGSQGEISLHGARIGSITAASCVLWVGIRKEIIKLVCFGQMRGCRAQWRKQHETQTNFSLIFDCQQGVPNYLNV